MPRAAGRPHVALPDSTTPLRHHPSPAERAKKAAFGNEFRVIRNLTVRRSTGLCRAPPGQHRHQEADESRTGGTGDSHCPAAGGWGPGAGPDNLWGPLKPHDKALKAGLKAACVRWRKAEEAWTNRHSLQNLSSFRLAQSLVSQDDAGPESDGVWSHDQLSRCANSENTSQVHNGQPSGHQEALTRKPRRIETGSAIRRRTDLRSSPI